MTNEPTGPQRTEPPARPDDRTTDGTPRPPEPERLPVPTDQAARDRILSALDTNLLVEAGAGSGKTTSLAGRMVALVREGVAEADQIAAVTFTRKAAVELRERFQEGIESELRAATDSTTQRTLARALTEIDRTFLGTIHAFAARLLRERPLEAGLDPAFRELQENEEIALRTQFWNEWLEQLAADADPDLLSLSDAGLRPAQLRHAFDQMVDNLDLDFPAVTVAAPTPEEVDLVRRRLDGLLDRAEAMMPPAAPDKGWGDVQKKVRRALHARQHRAWSDPHAFLSEVRAFQSGTTRITLNRWEPDRKAQGPVKQLRDDIEEFCGADGPVRPLLARWYAHRYPFAVRFVTKAARDYAAERRRLGVVTFQDLLLLTAELLRSRPRTRRDLGHRYRHLLIDEFQDTDPVQAEIAFLLASEPSEEELARGRSETWHRATPRPGALFVVGDPKQSIYRFRRADIAVYEQVRARFQDFGEVLALETNFRSVLDVAGLVNDVFAEAFGAEEPPIQARFRPLRPLRPFPGETPPGRGIFHYTLPDEAKEHAGGRTAWEAERLAAWIAERVRRGERRPGDFLVLTRRKPNLSVFARAIEERGLPLEVAGAGIGFELELDELRLLLRALTDPGDPVGVAAVLTGLFVGLDHEQLTQHRLAGGTLDPREAALAVETLGALGDHRPTEPHDEGDSDVGASVPEGFVGENDANREAPRGNPDVLSALLRMHGWWLRAQHEPADVFVGALVDELALFPHAAAGDLGSIRAGVLAYALDAVRSAVAAGESSLIGALDALETALAWEEAEAPLRPGATDVVRLMNVHKAKGLEAPVVVLADAEKGPWSSVDLHVERSAEGASRAWFQVGEHQQYRTIPIACPLEWEDMLAHEDRCEAAEEQRLLYVAATRARDELVVGRSSVRNPPWGIFHDWLTAHGYTIELPELDGAHRDPLEATPDALAARGGEADRRRAEAGRATVRFATVTEMAKGRAASPATERGSPASAGEASGERQSESGPRGYEWGSVIHAVLAAAARGAQTEELRHLGRNLLREYDRPVDSAGEPRELDALLSLLGRVTESEVWERARRAEVVLAEVPIALTIDGTVTHTTDSAAQASATRAEVVLEGVLDLVFLEPEGWVVVDYKTDRGDDPEFEERSRRYLEQVRLYAEAWERVVEAPVVEALVFYATQQRVERA